MKRENNFCTLAQAKRLKELGIVQESLFYHYQQFVNGQEAFGLYPMDYEDYGRLAENESMVRALDGESKNQIYSAFTVAELGVMLPCRIWDIEKHYDLSLTKADNTWHQESTGTKTEFEYEYSFMDHEKVMHILDDEQCNYPTEAQARAAMLIYLLENNHITSSEVNSRLLTA